MAPRSRSIPERWNQLDVRTIEMIARLNESERQALIDFANMEEPQRQHLTELASMSPTQIVRLKQFVSLPDDKWKAGFDIVTRSVVFWKVFKTVPLFVGALVVFLTSLAKLWEWISPYIKIGAR